MDNAKQINTAREPRTEQQRRINTFLRCSAKYLGVDWPVNPASESVSVVSPHLVKIPRFF